MIRAMDINLDQSVLSLLKIRKGDWRAVALAAEVSYSWLSKFANGHIPNPGYATLSRLHKVLQQPISPASPAQAATDSVAHGV